jgi:hypothetical protein
LERRHSRCRSSENNNQIRKINTMKQNMLLLIATLLIGTAVGPLAPFAQAQRNRGTTPALDSAAKEALIEVLAGEDGEYAARATYAAILDAFGDDVQPYANILVAEQKHVEALIQQCVKFGVPIPPDPYLGQVEAPASLLEAAEAGVAAELLNIAMYDELVDAVAKYPSLVRVFTNLQAASLNNHLPAFEAAVENGGTTPVASAAGRGKRGGAQNGKQARAPDGTCRAQ